MSKARGLKCKGHRGDGQPCGQFAMRGQLVCGKHGGRAPRAKAAAAIRIEEERAMTELARLRVEPVTNALEALQQHAGIVVAFRDRMAAVVNKLGEDSIRYEGKLHGEMLRAELGLWERALDRCSVTLTGLARAQVDDRLAAISQRKADNLAGALAAALLASGLPPEQANAVRHDFARRLLVIHGESAA